MGISKDRALAMGRSIKTLRSKRDFTPVSYTHLDVYKRQPMRRMERRPRGARGRSATSTAMSLPVHSTPPRRSSTSGFARCTDGRTSDPPMLS